VYFDGDGDMNITNDIDKAIKLFHRSAELGYAGAYGNLARIYMKVDGVSKDEANARQYFEISTMAGDVDSRLWLGTDDANAGRFDRAIKRWLIGASSGDIRAVNNIKMTMKVGYAIRDHYAPALRGYKQYLDEVRSEQRDKAAAHRDEFKYLMDGKD
jgi:TPR repeat protein